MSTTPNKNCAVVGVGVLGTSLCRQLLDEDDSWQVTGITKTSNQHADILNQVGAHHSDRFSLVTGDAVSDERFDSVVFCAPPSGFEDYPAAVKDAVDNLWVGPEQGGVFVFTSSGAM